MWEFLSVVFSFVFLVRYNCKTDKSLHFIFLTGIIIWMIWGGCSLSSRRTRLSLISRWSRLCLSDRLSRLLLRRSRSRWRSRLSRRCLSWRSTFRRCSSRCARSLRRSSRSLSASRAGSAKYGTYSSSSDSDDSEDSDSDGDGVRCLYRRGDGGRFSRWICSWNKLRKWNWLFSHSGNYTI